MITKRTFLKSSLILGGSVALGTLVYWKIPADELIADLDKLPLKFFTADDQIVLSAIIPVMLSGTGINKETAIRTIINMDASIQFLSLTAQSELRDLFNLLANKLGRALLAGIWSTWRTASPEDIIQFLRGWQNSFMELLQIGYQGLTQLVFGNYYSESSSWVHLDYPGPPSLKFQS